MNVSENMKKESLKIQEKATSMLRAANKIHSIVDIYIKLNDQAMLVDGWQGVTSTPNFSCEVLAEKLEMKYSSLREMNNKAAFEMNKLSFIDRSKATIAIKKEIPNLHWYLKKSIYNF